MSKFARRERVTYDELCHFIQPLKMELPIALQSTFVYKHTLIDYLKVINEEVVESLFSGLDNDKRAYIKDCLPIAFVPHKDGYTVSFSPSLFIKNVITILGRTNSVDLDDYFLPFYNLDDERELEVFKTATKNRIRLIKKRIINESLRKDLDVLNSNIDEIIKIKDFNLDKMVSNCVEMKTLLFYLAFSSLRKMDRSDSSIYSVLPMAYMKDVVEPDALQFPKNVYLESSSYKHGINDFVHEYNRLHIIKRNLFNHYATDNLGVNTYIGNFELLPSGEVIRKLKEQGARQRNSSNVDYDKYYKLYNTKINYYFHTDIKHILVGNMGLEGYYAFVYGNEYIVADKFYNKLLVPDEKRTILTHEEGIYAVPSDRLDVLAMDKPKIMEEKKKDTRIKKHNHDPNNTWINRVNAIIESANVSTALFTDELTELENKGVLKLSKKL